MTFQALYEMAQAISGDTSTATELELKRDINTGNKRFNAALNNYFNRKSKSANTVADQQYYQLPADAGKVLGMDFLETATRRHPLTQIVSEASWRLMNIDTTSAGVLTHWFQKGRDEVGVYPVPSAATTGGLIIYYEPKGYRFSQDDYTTGTVALTEGSATVTGTGTAFTAGMVGREFTITDGSDGYEYRIASYTSTTVITLEEPFIGFSGSGKTFTIGEAPLFPAEYHESLVDFALARFYQKNNNATRAQYHMSGDMRRPGLWESAITDAQGRYSSSSSSQVIIEGDTAAYNYWQDNTVSISE